MMSIIDLLVQTKKEIGIHTTEPDPFLPDEEPVVRISAFCQISEDRAQEVFDYVEDLGGQWNVTYKHNNGMITVHVRFKFSPNDEKVAVAKIINRHWFEAKYQDREALKDYVYDVMTASGKQL